MKVLGISAYYHDSAACLVDGGVIVAAVQEERFSRIRHDSGLPKKSIAYCLDVGGVAPEDLDAIVYYENPLLKMDRALSSGLAASSGLDFPINSDSLKKLISSRLWVESHLRDYLGFLGKRNELLYSEHHLSHAASAFYPSPFQNSAILTIDGVGEWSTLSIGYGSESNIELLKDIRYPHSLGLLYSTFTQYCGFKVNSGEYKLMGLAPFGKPVYSDLIFENLIDLKDDGSFRLNTKFFGFLDSDEMLSTHFIDLLGRPARVPESEIDPFYADVAASIQKVLELAVERLCRHARKLTGAGNLVLAGGVALNCVSNANLLEKNIFDKIWVQPAAGDAGGALGAALLVAHREFCEARRYSVNLMDGMQNSLLGPSFTNDQIIAYLNFNALPFEFVESDDLLFDQIAEYLSQGKVVGFFRGRMEFGPRALGSRSIIASARIPNMQSILNEKVKFRESFRPFAPAVKVERASEYFNIDIESPYMLFTFKVANRYRKSDYVFKGVEHSRDFFSRKDNSLIPSVTHVDFSARVQTVNRDSHGAFHALLSALERLTGDALVVNTSFNIRGEPIVCDPEDAYRCFMGTNIDVLILENCILRKENQPIFIQNENYLQTYSLD